MKNKDDKLMWLTFFMIFVAFVVVGVLLGIA